MRRRISLFRTTALRLTLVHASLFSLLIASTLGYIYWSMRGQIEAQIDDRLQMESAVLVNLYQSGQLTIFMDALRKRNQENYYGHFYYLSSTNSGLLIGPQGWSLRISAVRTRTTIRLADVIELPPGSKRMEQPFRITDAYLSNDLRLLIGHQITDEQTLLNHTFKLVCGASIITLLLAVIGGVLVSNHVLRRVDSVSSITNEIMDGDLSQRVPVTNRNDEFDALAKRINKMLSRIEQLVHAMQQVTHNVAHDLRSPLSRLRNRLEVTLLEHRDSEEYRNSMQQAIEDADGLIKTFNALLSIARLRSGIDKSQWQTIQLGSLALELADLYEPVAEESNMLFVSAIQANPYILANRHLIAQALTNLLDNAIKYSGQNSTITLEVGDSPAGAFLGVHDRGPGIDRASREFVMQPFVRLETERSTPGNGLGLSLVKAICEFHSASLTLRDNQPGLSAIIQFKSTDL